MPEQGIYLGIKETIAAVCSFLLASMVGWKLFFSAKLQQINDLDEKIDSHIAHEENKLQAIENKITAVGGRVDEVLTILATWKQ